MTRKNNAKKQVPRESVELRRARLVVDLARELLGPGHNVTNGCLCVPISADEFQQALRQRYANLEPALVFRSESSTERARLSRTPESSHLPRVLLRKGRPRAASVAASASKRQSG